MYFNSSLQQQLLTFDNENDSVKDLPVLGIDPQTYALKGEYGGNYYARDKVREFPLIKKQKMNVTKTTNFIEASRKWLKIPKS